MHYINCPYCEKIVNMYDMSGFTISYPIRLKEQQKCPSCGAEFILKVEVDSDGFVYMFSYKPSAYT